MAVTEENSGPYTTTSAVLGIIDRFRNRGLSTPFTNDVLIRSGVSDSLVPRTMQTLITLELIDESHMPTETLENLRRASAPDLKEHMSAWIRSVYAEILNFADPNDDETAIRDAFRSYKPVGQQHRMVSLFMGLCRAAGLRQDDQPISKKRSRSPSMPPVPRKSKFKVRSTKQHQASAPLNMPPAVAGLIKSLPESGTWTAEERNDFIITFTAVLDFSIKVVEKPKEEADDD